MPTPINQLKREAIADLKAEWQARVDSLGHSLDTMPSLDPDALAIAPKWTIRNGEWCQVLCEIQRGPNGLIERPIGAKI